MINWDEFEHIHVIKKLKSILGTWWNIDVIFTDERGKVRVGEIEKTRVYNKCTHLIIKDENLLQGFQELSAAAISDLKITGNRFVLKEWDTLGFSVCFLPIIIENELMGTVVAAGFKTSDISTEFLEQFKQKLLSHGMNEVDATECKSKIKYVPEQDREHFIDLIELVSHEIIVLHLEISSREERIKELNKELGSRYKYDNMIGKSKSMQTLYSLLDKIKFSETTVLIQGENGTGKELIAKSIHYNSQRKDRPFVIQNCSAFNDNLLESELFGHTKGAFTGAIKDKKGLFEMANFGTFFLDEIGDTSPTMQVKLLRVLQEGTFIPVGSTQQRKVDVRILAATNRDLKKMVADGTFREDLYYRLNVINIRVPTLKDRKEDIPLLSEFFLEKACERSKVPKKILTKRALEKLYDYNWPGNVRELQNEMERILVVSGNETKITADLLSGKIVEKSQANKVQGTRVDGKLKDAIEELERNMIREGLRRTGWNKSRLAKELGISRAGLITKVEKYELEKRKQRA